MARFSSCVVQSGIVLPYQAVRYQIADAIHLVLHLGRHEGRRLVRELIRIGATTWTTIATNAGSCSHRARVARTTSEVRHESATGKDQGSHSRGCK